MNKRRQTPLGIRFTAEQLAKIDRLVEKLRKQTGFSVTRSDVIRRLVDAALAREKA